MLMSDESMPVTTPFILEVITPVSIGNGQEVTVFDYILDSSNQDVYILNQKKWFQYLDSLHKLTDYEAYIKCYTLKQTKETIYEWMERTIGIPDDTVLSSLSKRQLRCVKSSLSKKSLNNVYLCMTALNGMPYIPGSSLKGVIISAVIAYIVENNEAFRREWRNKLIDASNNDRELRRCTKEYGKALDTLILSCIKKVTGEEHRDGVKKLFHSISVSDVMLPSKDKIATYILPRYDSVAGQYERNALSVYRECITPNTKLEGMLSVNIQELRKVGIHSVTELVKIVEMHTQRLLQRWKQVFRGNVEQSCICDLEGVTCLLGSSIGFLHKTLLLPLFDDPRDEVNVIKSVISLQKDFKIHKHWQDRIISPRTLKLTKYKGKDYIFGGVKLHFEND